MTDVEGADISIEHFIQENEQNEKGQIPEFFKRSCVFITGCTGFMGRVLIEKLIRSCPNVEKIYLLIRPKSGKTPMNRLEELFHGPLYERMKTEVGDFMNRVEVVPGDCLKPWLGLSEAYVHLLTENVNVVFHTAAIVRFDTKLKTAVFTNIRATHHLLEIARKMRKLEAFLYVSTAFSNCDKQLIEETFYEPPINASCIMHMAETMDDKIFEKITPGLLGTWPNCYALSKAISEDVVRTCGGGLPIAVVRPSIVIATYKEPIAGWINNFYGPTGVVAGAGIGILRSVYCNDSLLADLVPVDLVINVIITAAWDVAKSRREQINLEISNDENFYSGSMGSNVSGGGIKKSGPELRRALKSEVPVYNYVSSNRCPLTWKQFMKLNERAEPEIPSTLSVWYYCFRLNKHKFVYQLYVFFLHLVPAVFVDLVTIIIGKSPKMLAAYKKIHRFSDVISYFCTHQWQFNDGNVVALWNRMSLADRKEFDFNIEHLRWEEYFYTHMRGIRVYLFKESLDTVPEGRRKRNRLMLAHYTLVAILCASILFIIYILF